MYIPARFSAILFSALLSAIMVCIVSAFVLAISQGIHTGFAGQWFKSCITTWPYQWGQTRLVLHIEDGWEQKNEVSEPLFNP